MIFNLKCLHYYCISSFKIIEKNLINTIQSTIRHKVCFLSGMIKLKFSKTVFKK